ncbi:hypothetical protein CFOL_v3_23727 [Cephalotus follicularis]|uniref:Uncharacterized protein n=1 Tax=Cephalotus follicularis TaxID=3775 RepID=A0A1Q3CJ28_CEPFO|nr:hypothetical protein CFOL_v3_23727 [Cephalotus follicularis]
MSVKKSPALNKDKEVKRNASSKRRRLDSCLPFMEIKIEAAAAGSSSSSSSLKKVDSSKFKDEIKRWAKAVVAYARQVSGRFGSTRKSGRIGSNSSSSDSSRDASMT